MQNDRVVAINSTTQMDLQGQAASESAGHRHISGTGGQSQFVRGAYASKGGKSFICMTSTYERHGVRASRVVVDLTPGNVITTTRADMMYVVTEYGIVNLKGKSIPERARAMISIAHPDFREDLERDARGHGLIPRGSLLTHHRPRERLDEVLEQDRTVTTPRRRGAGRPRPGAFRPERRRRDRRKPGASTAPITRSDAHDGAVSQSGRVPR